MKVDNVGKGVEARYWLGGFLHVRRRNDEYTNTQNFLILTKSFITQELPKEGEISKAHQIDFLNKSLDLFKDKDTCAIDDFINEVMVEADIIEKFHHYKHRCEDETGISIDDNHSVSEAVQKKQQRSFRRVIQLDKKKLKSLLTVTAKTLNKVRTKKVTSIKCIVIKKNRSLCILVLIRQCSINRSLYSNFLHRYKPILL